MHCPICRISLGGATLLARCPRHGWVEPVPFGPSVLLFRGPVGGESAPPRDRSGLGSGGSDRGEVVEILPGELGRVLARLALLEDRAGRIESTDPAQARRAYRRSLALAERAAFAAPDDRRLLAVRARLHGALSRVAAACGHLGEASAGRERAIALADRRARLWPDDPEALRGLATALETVADPDGDLLPGDQPLVARALAARRALLRLAPDDRENRAALERDRTAATWMELAWGRGPRRPPPSEPRHRHRDRLRARLPALRAELDRARWAALEAPGEAIAAADRVVAGVLAGVYTGELGRPSACTREELELRVLDLPFVPHRLELAITEVDYQVAWDELSMTLSVEAGGTPGAHAVRAAARVLAWYADEYLGLGSAAGADLRAAGESFPAGRPERVGAPYPEAGAAGEEPVPAGRRLVGEGDQPLAPPGPLHPAQEAAARRLGVPATIVDEATGMVLVLVPGGLFRMGTGPGDELASEEELPRRWARVAPFYCGIAPVLQGEWSRVTGKNPSAFSGPRRPVECVSREEIDDFLGRANEGRPGPPLRLLSESEWEHSARGGTTDAWWWGPRYRAGWANCAEAGLGRLQESSEVGRFPANPYGLFDVAGNVEELCAADLPADRSLLPAPSPPPVAPGNRVNILRGGSWDSSPDESRSSARRTLSADGGLEVEPTIGFRCARDVGGG